MRFVNDEIILNEEAIFNGKNKKAVYIVLMHTGTVLANIIKKVTHDEFSHACISFNSKLDPLYSFGSKPIQDDNKHGNGIGFCINNKHDTFFDTHKTTYKVYVMYVSTLSYNKMKNRLDFFLKNKDTLKYDFKGLFDIWFGISSEDHEKYFCSRFVMDLINSGIELSKAPSLWKPNDIAFLNNISLVNHGNDFADYNYRKTDKNCKLIKMGKYDERKILI